jgi:Ser/Thr protein kinase RdoA (MazF antagonist)
MIMCPSKPPRPRFTEEEAATLAEELYGITGQLRELPSERGQNFSLHIDGHVRHVLKIANALEKRDVPELQVQAVRFLAKTVPEFNWPDVRRTIAGEDIAVIQHRGGTDHFVRLMTYLPGVFLPGSSRISRSFFTAWEFSSLPWTGPSPPSIIPPLRVSCTGI